MWFILLTIFLIILLKYLYKLNVDYVLLSFCKRIKTEDGSRLDDKVCIIPGVVPIFGNNFDLLDLTPETLFNLARKLNLFTKGKSYVMYFLRYPFYCITTAEDAMELFQSATILEKAACYDLVKPFLGDGLLISSGRKWFARRKMLTPAFHFNILQSFNDIFKEQSLELLKKLHRLQDDQINVIEIMSEFSLNSVIETALGVNLNDISGSDQYRQIIHDIELVIVKRVCCPLYNYEFIFRIWGPYKKHTNDVQIAKNFTSKIIEKKREKYHQTLQQNAENLTESNNFGKKQRYAMLDTLLSEESHGNIDHEGICDEVNTFMFEGYDTTSTCMVFTILNLAWHPDIQNKCREEIKTIGDYTSLKIFDFNKLQYLECVLKESLRMYPSVPFLARTCLNETLLNGLILPPKTQINLQIYDIMRDPNHFDDPNSFKPERFLPENSRNRHPFAFVPFSAGSRNCIGQKFAILEMKALLVAILTDFQILPITTLDNLILENGLILRTQQQIYVKLKKISEVK